MNLRRPLSLRMAALLAGLALVTGACTSSTSPADTGAVPPRESPPRDDEPATTAPTAGTPDAGAPGALVWEDLGDGTQGTYVEVPADYSDPEGGTFDIRVVRRPAADPALRIGSLLVNPGGPGFGGATLATNATYYFADDLLQRFDIVGFDPRGTGDSRPAIDCIDDYDSTLLLDPTPETPEEEAALRRDAEAFVEGCAESLGDDLMLFSTNNTARDMDAIRRALGEERISYFGFSYGSELGAVWATLFPETVRAAVLDGAVDPTASDEDSIRQQMTGFNASVESFLQWCTDRGCRFDDRGDPRDSFLATRDRIDRETVPGPAGRPAVNYSVWQTAVVFAMYSDELWSTLDQALTLAAEGDGTLLMLLNDAYYQRGEDGRWGDELEAFNVITCADTDNREGREVALRLRDELLEIAPLLFLDGVDPGYGCSLFPDAIDPRIHPDGAGAGTIVVIGTTGDPATPLSSTRAMADTLEGGVLLVVEADKHGGYQVDPCIDDLVHRYLIDLQTPGAGC